MDSLTLFSSLALVLLVTLQVLELCDCASIDQIISEAAESPEAFNFLHDDVGTVKVELDMLFTREQWAEIQRLNSTTIEEIRTKRKAVRPLSSRWTRKTVPYSMSNHFSGGERSVITSALNEWMRYTCIKFRRSRGNENRINFQNGGGCSSFVGMLGRGSQPVTLGRGCRHKGVVIHEVGHAIGFHHEQTRPDRDNYVTIVHRNIPASVRFNFQKYSTGVINTYSVPYDYRSIMHYGSTAFSTNGQRTIITKNPQFQNVIGNRQGLSFRDIKLANTIYNCAESCPQRSCPGEGFVGKDCKCWCPGSPVKECGGGGGVTTQRPVTRRPVTQPPVTQRPTTRRPTGNCIDSHRHCQSWSSRGECKKNPAYMLVYCKHSCNQCGSVTAICRNSSPYCSSWASRGFCRRGLFVMFMRRECKKSCNMCGRSAPAATSWSAASACVDKSRDCGYWARTGECTKNPSYMLQKCKRSCNVCGTGRK